MSDEDLTCSANAIAALYREIVWGQFGDERLATVTTAPSHAQKCTDCKRPVYKSIRDASKHYCSWCRKYFPSA